MEKVEIVWNKFMSVIPIIDPQGLLVLNIVLFFVLLLFITYSSSKSKKMVSKVPNININENLLKEIKEINEELEQNRIYHHKVDSVIADMSDKLRGIKRVEIVRYNPYVDMGVGGNQSFSLAVVDQKGDGFILTSLYSRDKTRNLLKKIDSFAPDSELSAEETEVLKKVRS